MTDIPNWDLHCHSSASDGLLSPTELVERASRNGVDMLALTDHDEVSGLLEARTAAASCGMRFIDGVEISVTWGGTTVHVVGLGIDSRNAELADGLSAIRAGRIARAHRMDEALRAAGIEGSFEGALAYVRNPNVISRTHFARFLVQKGYAPEVGSVFRNYLVKNKPGHVPHQWASLQEALRWIRSSGGIAVLAHPGRYRLSRTELRGLLTEFRDTGGVAIETVTGNHTREQYEEFGQLAREFGLLGSRGSDFHGPGESKVDLGKLPAVEQNLKSVWEIL